MKIHSRTVVHQAAVKLKKIREELGNSISEMANRLDVSHSCYYKYERGENFPGITALKRLSEDYGISMDWLIFDKGPKHFDGKVRQKDLEKEQNKTQAAEQKLSETEKELREVKQKLDTAEERFLASLKPGLKELLDTIDSNPVFYHQFMLSFEKFKAGNSDVSNSSAYLK